MINRSIKNHLIMNIITKEAIIKIKFMKMMKGNIEKINKI